MFATKKSPAPSGLSLEAGHIPGDDLLSQDLSSHYHWRCGVSLPGSEWDRVVPPRSGHQRVIFVPASLPIRKLGLWGSELCGRLVESLWLSVECPEEDVASRSLFLLSTINSKLSTSSSPAL